MHLITINDIVNSANERFFAYHVFTNANEIYKTLSIIINTMLIHVKNQSSINPKFNEFGYIEWIFTNTKDTHTTNTLDCDMITLNPRKFNHPV